ncbi:MAG: hypothetical protein MR924_13900 [Prevotella sp.]|nr:hypothetical protein [Prevotella sp.]
MAILNGIIKKLNGSAGSLTFKQVNGQTVVSEKVTAVKKSNTPAQMPSAPSGATWCRCKRAFVRSSTTATSRSPRDAVTSTCS